MKWEYKIVMIRESIIIQKTIDKLNKLGEDGWELVNIDIDDGLGRQCYMKRCVDNDNT